MSGLPGHGLRVELGKDAREPTSASSSPGGDVLTSGRRGMLAVLCCRLVSRRVRLVLVWHCLRRACVASQR